MRSPRHARATRSASSSTSWAASRGQEDAAVAEAANIQLNCGGLAVQSQLEAAAGAHFYASTPARFMMGAAEFVFGLNTTAQDPLCPESDFKVRDGHVDVPEGPGLGVTIDEGLLKKNTLLHEVVG